MLCKLHKVSKGHSMDQVKSSCAVCRAVYFKNAALGVWTQYLDVIGDVRRHSNSSKMASMVVK